MLREVSETHFRKVALRPTVRRGVRDGRRRGGRQGGCGAGRRGRRRGRGEGGRGGGSSAAPCESQRPKRRIRKARSNHFQGHAKSPKCHTSIRIPLLHSLGDRDDCPFRSSSGTAHTFDVTAVCVLSGVGINRHQDHLTSAAAAATLYSSELAAQSTVVSCPPL